jgi:hypothetical protein
MEENHIDLYLLQETHTRGMCNTSDEVRINNHLVFLHGCKDINDNPNRGGVGIILGPRAIKAWKKVGALPS